MDGLLVDSEPLWHEAEIEILGALGVPIAADDCRQTKGMFVNEVTHYWFGRYPWTGPDPDQVAVEVLDAVIELIVTKGTRMPGVDETIARCRTHGLSLALASSSPHRLISAVLHHFELTDTFTVVHSAEHEPYGKPHPAVFLTTAERLQVAPTRCLVWEDAAAGVLAAKAAKMACIAVPEVRERSQPAFAIADAVLGSLDEMTEDLWQQLVARRLAADPFAPPLGPAT